MPAPVSAPGRPARRGSAMPIRLGLAIAAAVLLVAALASEASAKPLFGVVPQDGALPESRDLDRMPKAGIGGIRLLAHWPTIEKLPGVYDWSVLDTIVRETTARGIQPFLFLYGSPTWAAEADGRSCSFDACSVFAPASDSTRAAFAAFAGAAAARYGPGGDFWESPVPVPAADVVAGDDVGGGAAGEGSLPDCPIPVLCPPPPPPPPPPPGPPPDPTEPPCQCDTPSPITSWQIWNEQNSDKYFAPKVKVKRYARLLEGASTAIKAEDPSAEIVLGGMWGPASARKVVLPVKTYFKRLYAIDGIEDSFDSIALHPYANTARLSIYAIELARKTVKRAGDGAAGTWISEMGWAAGGPRSNPYVKGLDGQARQLSRALSKIKRRARSFNLGGVFWYSWRDIAGGGAICEWCGHAGLRDRDGSSKPAWRAFARVARS